MSGDLFAELVRRSGLSGVFATTAIKRVCERAKLLPERLTRGDVERLLPDLERTLAIYLPREDAAARLQDIRELATSG